MGLDAGTRLGPYELAGRLGAGGMGEVYRARDTRIDRTVAIKVLAAGFGNDPAARERFDREARAISQLDHPHICALHDVGTQDGLAFLVMQFVDGETLASRLTRGPMPLDEAVPVARQIADALEAAHERGIVHRDLKPANVMVSASGAVKVLDFGLAKDGATPSNLSMSPTMLGATGAGVILGTAAYMSPEQARGRVVDKRSDVWAFGCVLYEMLTGAQAFAGETVADILAAVVHKDPDWSKLPLTTPTHIRELIERCLQKDARQRLRDIGEARIALERADTPSAEPVRAAAAPTSARSRRAVWAFAAALAAAVVALGAYAWRTTTGAPPVAAPVAHLSMTFPLGVHLGQPQPSLALSPDGRRVAYTGGRADTEASLFLRPLDRAEPTVLAATSNRNAFFSPDGQWIGLTGARLFRTSAASGPLVPMCDSPGGTIYGATWTSRDQIVFAVPSSGLWRCAATGSAPEQIATGRFYYPDALPDGRHVVTTADNPAARTADDLRIVLVNLENGTVRPLLEGGTYVRYAASGHLVYLRSGALMAVPFDTQRGELRGQPIAVVPDVFMNPALPGANFALSPNGTLVYAPGTAQDFQNALLIVGAEGSRPLTDVRRSYQTPKLSPDGTRVAVIVSQLQSAAWLLEIERGVLSRLTPDGCDVGALSWLPDGSGVVVAASTADEPRRHLYRIRAEAGASMERLTTSESLQTLGTPTPDGKHLVVVENRPGQSPSLSIMTLDGDRTLRPLLDRASAPALSPDGRWLAFESDRAGPVTTYVADFSDLKQTTQVASDRGRFPVWSRTGRLYYRQESSIMAVTVSGRGTPTISKPELIAHVPDAAAATAQFDVMPDGRVLVTDTKSLGWAHELKIVLNWFTELRQNAPPSP